MQPTQAETFMCQACGYAFNATYEQVAENPNCPKCGATGSIVLHERRASGVKRKTTKPVARPSTRSLKRPTTRSVARPTSRMVPQAAPARSRESGEYVEVSADAAYGTKGNQRALLNGALVLGIGILLVAILYLAAVSLQKDHGERTRQQREQVMDIQDFERAIDESLARARTELNRIPDARVVETTNFDPVIDAIVATGGERPNWTAPVRPGTPHRVHGFVIVAPDPRTGKEVHGFVMLLYYLTTAEVSAATSEIQNALGGRTRNYNFRTREPMWFAAYGGVSYGGEVYDAVNNAMNMAQPSSFRQFTDRMGGRDN